MTYLNQAIVIVENIMSYNRDTMGFNPTGLQGVY